jgi:hypothetical protein
MRTFQVGARFKSNDVTDIVEVRWVHPQDPCCAVVFNIENHAARHRVITPLDGPRSATA